MNEKKVFSVVIPVYQNEPNLHHTITYIISNKERLFMNYDLEMVLVNDGSVDKSYEIMKEYQKKYPQIIKIANFTRNFGQMAATSYGIKIAKGDIVGVIAADLQEPFDLFSDMLKKWEEGYQLIFAARKERPEKGLGAIFSKITNKLVKRYIDDKFPEGGFDFYLMDRVVVNEFNQISERNGWPQVLLLWLGFKCTNVDYVRVERAAGKSGWNTSKKIKLFIDIFTANSYIPLRVMSFGGFICSFIAFAIMIFVVIRTLVFSSPVLGWTSLAALITFFSGLLLMSVGILGEYMWRIFDYVKGRPQYIVDEKIDDIEQK